MAADASTPVLTRIAARRPSVVGVLGTALVGVLIFWLVVNFTKGPSYFIEVFFIGIATGCVYALIALGYTLVYGILELINFAHGDVFMLGSWISLSVAAHKIGLTQSTSGFKVVWGLGLTLLAAMAFCGILNVTIERLAYRPLRNAPRLA